MEYNESSNCEFAREYPGGGYSCDLSAGTSGWYACRNKCSSFKLRAYREDITLRDMLFELFDNLNWYHKCQCGHMWSEKKGRFGEVYCPKQPNLTVTAGSYVGMASGHSLSSITAKQYYEVRRINGI
jgi:hypothetical protein